MQQAPMMQTRWQQQAPMMQTGWQQQARNPSNAATMMAGANNMDTEDYGAVQEMKTPKDGVLDYGHKNIDGNLSSKDGDSTVSLSAIMIRWASLEFVCFMTFLITVVFICRLYMYHDELVVVLMGVVVFIAFIMYSYYTEKWKVWYSRLTLMSLFVGSLFGLRLHYRELIYYYHYRDMMRYTNIAPSASTMQFLDAGMLQFTGNTKVDVTRAVGYRSATRAQTLCVAPVVDPSMQPTDEVQFWAVGVNCCTWRGSFKCGDAKDSDANSGLLVLDWRTLVSPMMEWTVENALFQEDFDSAIKLQGAIYGTRAANNIRLVEWARDPIKLQDRYFWTAFNLGCAVSALYLVVSLVMSFLAAFGWKRIKKISRRLL